MMEVIGNAAGVGTAIGVQVAMDAECGVDHLSDTRASELRYPVIRGWHAG
jgi:hypothetical protein